MGLHKLFGSVLGGKSSPAQRVGEVPCASRGMDGFAAVPLPHFQWGRT